MTFHQFVSKASPWCVLVALLCLGSWNCSGEPDKKTDPPPVDGGLTYHKDIKHIFTKSCVGCHQAGGIGPFDLSTYDKVKPLAALISEEVKSRRMPPWQPGDGCQEYVGNTALSDKDIKTITDWVAAGAAEGDPADAKKQEIPKPVGISRVDLTLKMAAPFDQYKKPDDYRCFVIDWPEKEKKYVTGIQITPGNTQVVHHVIAVVAGPSELEKIAKLEANDALPGYECYGSPGPGLQTKSLGSWVPGAQQRDFPSGAGVSVEPGSKVILQMHYNAAMSNPGSDQSSISFKIDKEVDKEYKRIPLTKPAWVVGGEMSIPAGSSDTTLSYTFDPATGLAGRSFTDNKPAALHSVTLHMHTRGKSGKIWIKRKDGTEVCLLNIPKWDFNWQGDYRFTKPIELNPGDKVGIQCSWDNTAENQPLVDGKKIKPTDLKWGEGTQDEMCLGAIKFVEK